MKLNISTKTAAAISVNTLICFVAQSDKVNDPLLKKIDQATDGAVGNLYESEEFLGREGQLAPLYAVPGFESSRVLLAGLGKSSGLDADSFRRVMGRAARHQSIKKSSSVALCFGRYEKPEFVQGAIEGCLLGKYKILEFKSGDDKIDKHKLSSMTGLASNKTKARTILKAMERGGIIAEGQLLARDLSFTPSNYLTPKLLADRAKKLARKYRFSCRVLDKQAIEKEKMGAYLSVAKGSVEPPQFLILEHKGAAQTQKPICLVGKGVMFDSGGISLKAGLNMHEMKQDMTGAAVVLATMVTAARLGIKRNLVGLIAACENMPAGDASKPGDVVTARNGKTIEIINTDAEGRLTLADALNYADKFKPQAVIDIATLTGAALYILGYAGAPIMGNRRNLLSLIEKSSKGVGENVWQMPIWDEYRDAMESDCADLVNAGVKAAGTLCAGAFLENFIGDWPWAHIDIAYMDAEPKGRDYIPRGATGWGVRLLTEVLSNWKKI